MTTSETLLIVVIAIGTAILCLVVALSLRQPEHDSAIAGLTFDEFCRRAQLAPVDAPVRTKVRGVSFSNPNGERREFIIQTRCRIGDALLLIREPENPHDSNAIAIARIIDDDGRNVKAVDILGHVSRDLAERLAPQMDHGATLVAEVKSVTGDLEVDVDGDDGYNAGLNITIYRMTKVKSASA